MPEAAALSVLVVDDQMSIRALVKQSLMTIGVKHITDAADGEEALRRLTLNPTHLVISDLTMPRMDGPACLSALRKVLPDARILVVSALGDRATALKALTHGAHGFLLKPFSDEQLVGSLEELIA